MTPKTQLHQRGQAMLILISWVGAALLLTVSSLTLSSLTHIRLVRDALEAFSASQAAEAGAERLFAEWIADPYPVEGVAYADEPFIDAAGVARGHYSVSVTHLVNGTWGIHATGRSNDVWRAVDATVQVRLGGPHEAFSRALFSNSDVVLPGASEVWGDVYVNGTLTATSGGVNATDDLGTHFGTNPSIADAPYGEVHYYPDDPADVWRVSTGTTATGNAHGFWQSATSITRTGMWLNPQYNVGNHDVTGSGQYWNRDAMGIETLWPSAATRFGERTGIATIEQRNPVFLPLVGNGSYGDFVGYYDLIVPKSSRLDSIVIVDNATGEYIHLGNGLNAAIVGTSSSTNGFPTQFTWIGTAFRDDGSVYSGALRFREGSVLWVNGNVSIGNIMAGKAVTVIASGAVTVSTATFPTESFNVIAYGNATFSANVTTLTGVAYSAGTLAFTNAASSPTLYGSFVANRLTFMGRPVNVTFVRDAVFLTGPWLPGGVTPTAEVVRWNEAAP